VQDGWVVEWLQNGLLQDFWEERVFVWRLVAANERVLAFLLAEQPVEKAERRSRNLNASRYVDCRVEGKLNTLDEMESYGIFQATGKFC
jgi:hypothetical protein